MLFNLNIITVILVLLNTIRSDTSDCQSEQCTNKENASLSRILSRRKRFLIYPDGSSFQFVLCVQTTAITLGSIFLYGNTAALAWTLPSDPALIHMLKGEKEVKRGDMKHIHYLDEDGNVVHKIPFERPTLIRPTIAKRSTDDKMTFKQKLELKLDKRMRNGKQLNREYLKYGHANKRTVEFHRSSRVGLYEKLEKYFTALGGNGRQCVLHKLCEAAQHSSHQGTFLEHLLAIVFTLPKGQKFDKEEHRMYDEAHTNNVDKCDELYPGCI